MNNVINLSKGEKIDLTKGGGVTRLQVGLNWDEAGSPVGGGIMGAIKGLLAGAVTGDIDVDSSVLMLDSSDRLIEMVYFGKLNSSCGSIKHLGDNLTGADLGKGKDDETIMIDLAKVPSKVNKLVVVANIYQCISRNQHFGLIGNANIKIYDQTGRQLCEYNMTSECAKATAIIVGEVYRYNGEWKFNAIGQGTADASIQDIAKRY